MALLLNIGHKERLLFWCHCLRTFPIIGGKFFPSNVSQISLLTSIIFYRKAPTVSTLEILNDILEKLSPYIENKEVDQDKLSLIRQCFLSLRNSAACGKMVQDNIVNATNILEHTSKLLDCMVLDNSKAYTTVLSALLQFLSNLIVNNNDVRPKVIEKCFDSFNVALFNTEISHIVAIIVYNLLKDNTNLIKDDFDFVNNIMILLTEEIENVTLILELLVENNVVTQAYNDLDNQHRLCLLDNLRLMQIEESVTCPVELTKILSEHFKKKSDCILKTVKDYVDSIEPLEVAKLLEYLASASSIEEHLAELQKDKSLLINCAFLLRSIHSAGKEEKNDFSALQKLSEVKINDTNIKNHPAFGFKACLIRLLGNLCWKHEENQNLVSSKIKCSARRLI